MIGQISARSSFKPTSVMEFGFNYLQQQVPINQEYKNNLPSIKFICSHKTSHKYLRCPCAPFAKARIWLTGCQGDNDCCTYWHP